MENIHRAWNDITLESAQFVLEQAEKKVQTTVDTAKSLTDRALNVMQFSIPLSLALIGLIIAEPKTEFFWLYMVILTFSVTASYLGLHVYDLYDVEDIGHRPSELLNEYDLRLNGEDQQLVFIFSAIVVIEKVIEINETNNDERQRVLFWAMMLVKFVIGSASVLLATGLLIPLFQ